MRVLLSALVVAGLLGACDSGGGEPAPRGEPDPPPPAITQAELTEHLEALQEIADHAGGTRAAGTPGEAATVDYIAARLREAGWRVELQPVRFPAFAAGRAEVTAGGRTLRRGRDFQVLSYSGSGGARGPLVAAGDGCEEDDFAAVPAGAIPLVDRGDCRFRDKARHAQGHGLGALIVATDRAGASGVGSATLGAPGIRIPVVLAALDTVEAGAAAELDVETESEQRTTHNVIAETPGGQGPTTVMAGGHLDSVDAGPGINDNGSGIATLIEVAEAIGRRPPGARVRLGFWAAEELGLIGSRRYVDSLGRGERCRLAAYLNFDMVGSRNAVPALYRDGNRRLGGIVERAAPGNLGGVDAGGTSDHAPFRDAGVPVNGIYTGASEPAPNGRPRDPCYHLACDTVENVDRATLLRMARAAAEAIERLSRRG